MKIKNLFYVSLAALSLAACSKDEAPAPQGSVVVKLTTAEPKTKADPNNTTKGYDAENTITSGTIYAFLGSTPQGSQTFSTENNQVTFNNLIAEQSYDFVAVANSAVSASTVAGFGILPINAPTEKSNFVMYKSASVSITEGANDISMVVERVLSAVQLNQVVRAQDNKGLPSVYTSSPIEIKSLALYSVNPTVQLDGKVISGDKENALALAAEFSEKTMEAGNGTLNINGTTVKERAYACPTATSATLFAVLTVEYTTPGITKSFNIPLSEGLVANTLYTLNVTITGVGSDTPGEPDDFGSATGSITAAPWSNGSVINADNQEN